MPCFHKNKNISIDREPLYIENGRLRATVHCGYKYSDQCKKCSAKKICDGFHGDYVAFHGTDEASPIQLKSQIRDPKYFINQQEKIVEKEEMSWAT